MLKLGFNSLSDEGASLIASSFGQEKRHHQNLSVLDLGFNGIGDEGCTAIALRVVAGNYILRTLYLAGNNIGQKGSMSIAGAILHGCSLSRLDMSANKLGAVGMKVLVGAVSESESRRQRLLQRQGGVKTSVQPVALEELRIADTSMNSQGFLAVPSMLVSNSSLRTLCLCNNGLDDRDLALFSQALTQNKSLPLASLLLSFNKITCVGVECLMNAIWGSQTLRELKIDNNKMQDRGAQLCSVVLGSVRLEVLDISFNRISTVGIKAIMKSLSENNSLQALSMAGIPMDQNASKAVSYALAYNSSLRAFNIDSCCIGYSGQRHIVAGIVSNRNVNLRALTGFPLGRTYQSIAVFHFFNTFLTFSCNPAAITVTLGVPQLPDDWGNDRVLTFMRFMWAHWKARNILSAADCRGPAPPATVAASAKQAFASLSQSEEAKLSFQKEMVEPESPPVLPLEAAILVRSNSGKNLQIPVWTNEVEPPREPEYYNEAWSSDTDSLDRSSSYTSSSQNSLHNSAAADPERRNKNLQWLRSHVRALNEVGNLAFSNADLWQLHQYFFSPVYSISDESDSLKDDGESSKDEGDMTPPPPSESDRDHAKAPPSTPVISSKQSNLGRAISFQTLGEVVAAAVGGIYASGPNKRRSLDESVDDEEPCAKRAKNLKPRIAYYPRVRVSLFLVRMIARKGEKGIEKVEDSDALIRTS